MLLHRNLFNIFLKSGSVSCMARQCNSTCAHPVQTIACCPLCTDCQFEGIVRQQGLTFISEVDACQQCVCQVKYSIEWLASDCVGCWLANSMWALSPASALWAEMFVIMNVLGICTSLLMHSQECMYVSVLRQVQCSARPSSVQKLTAWNLFTQSINAVLPVQVSKMELWWILLSDFSVVSLISLNRWGEMLKKTYIFNLKYAKVHFPVFLFEFLRDKSN